jgi:hypothetical protein
MRSGSRARTVATLVLGAILATSGIATPAMAETLVTREAPRKESRWKKAWAWSAAALMAATAADAATSMGGYELNPLLRGPGGQFGTRGMAIKLGVACAVIGAQYFLLKKKPEQAPYAFAANAAAAGLLSGVAVRNARLR